MPVRAIENLQDARRTGIGLVSLDSKTKNGGLPLTQANAPKSTRIVLLELAVASLARMQTLSGFGG
jgi:hypothetical protein